ncbi:MAG: fibronectin type III domain-containing protein [Bacteroidetes bacterium]|nr:fibronectin type III domain-containing protein [Bacteroidota bacterium]
MIFLFISKLALSDLSVSAKITKARRIVTMSTGNPNVPSPTPTLADITIAVDALAEAEEWMPGTKAQTIERNNREKALDTLLVRYQRYVEFTADGDPGIVLSTGIDIRDANSPVGILEIPSDFSAINTRVKKQVKLKWKPVKKRISYVVEYTIDPIGDGPFFNVECTRAAISLNGLNSDVKYYFRVATISTAGSSGFTEWMPCRPN